MNKWKIKINCSRMALMLVIGLFCSVVVAGEAENKVALESATAWLEQQQNQDGSWGQDAALRYSATATVIDTLKSSNNNNAAYYSGLAWVENHRANNVDDLSRKIEALLPHGNNITSDLFQLNESKLDLLQAGWGLSAIYNSSAIDSALALGAMIQAGDTAGEASAITYLLSSQLADGGWSVVNSSVSDYWISANVVLSLSLISTPSAEVTTALNSAISYLSTAPVGSSTLVLATVTRAIYSQNGLTPLVDTNITELLARQNLAGDWGDIYTTATISRLLSSLLGLDSAQNASRVSIEDQTLRQIINQQLGNNAFDNLTQGELLTITSLDLRGTNVASLSGLEYATNLQTLLVDPVANISGPATDAGKAGLTIFSFDTSASSDLDGTISSYLWSFGDGTTSTSAQTSHVYSISGQYTISLQVTDNAGLTGTTTTTVTIENAIAPTAIITAPTSGKTSVTNISFNGADSYDGDGNVISYLWSLGDGTTSTLSSLAHTYTVANDYTVTLTVTDDDGLTDVATTMVSIADNVAPIAGAGTDQNIDEATLVTLSGSGTDSDGTVVSYVWTQVGTPTVTLSDTTVGSPTFTAPLVDELTMLTFELTVTDNDGLPSVVADTVAIHVYPLDYAFQQDVGVDGLVSIEAENFDDNFTPGSESWNIDNTAGYSGDSAMSVLPDSGSSISIDYAVNSPRMDYQVNFTKLGTHYIWARGIGSSSESDSLHIGLDGVEVASSDQLNGFTTAWNWSNATMDSVVATIDVTTVGLHTLNVWMHEDGLVLDKLILTTNDAYVPAGMGPVESVQSGSNIVPMADAGIDQGVDEQALVTLNGSATDSDGTIAGYAWTQTVGPAVMLSNAAVASPSFTAPEVTVVTILIFELVATDNDGGLSPADTIVVTVNPVNEAPIPGVNDFYTDEDVALNSTLQATDPDGDVLNFSIQTNGIFGMAFITNAATGDFSYIPNSNENGVDTFAVTVSDGLFTVAFTASVTVNPVNDLPVANAGLSTSTDEQTVVNLDGSGSSDVEGPIMTYVWTQTPTATVILNGANTAMPSFTAPTVTAIEMLTFELVVTDNEGGASAASSVVIAVNPVNVTPVANAGPDQTANEGDVYNLNGTLSNDSDGTITAYAWTQTAGPDVSATLAGETTATPTFTVLAGVYVTFDLVVTDNDGAQSIADSVTVTINNAPITIGSNVTVDQNTLLNGTLAPLASDIDGDVLTYSLDPATPATLGAVVINNVTGAYTYT
ncbi:MAG: tandem-95 repeat protein, partial [Thiotrichaceae bacterium]|nr:tandem-95 repeat protein [Thiotrichaceae bacterium]